MNVLSRRLLNNFLSVAPIILIVLISHFFIAPIAVNYLLGFGIGTILLILGLSFFLIGVDLAITPLGQLTGLAIIKTNKLWFVIVSGMLLGFFISVAEPGLLVLASQISQASTGILSNVSLIMLVSIGMAIMVAIGFLRIIYRWPLFIMLLILYSAILVLALFATPSFIAIAFDTSGATTGVLAVPFILSLAFGISTIRQDSKSGEKDSFGLVAIASTGPIFTILLLNLFHPDLVFAGLNNSYGGDNFGFNTPFLDAFMPLLLESFIVLAPLLVIFLLLNRYSFKLKKGPFIRIIKGFIYTFAGLFIFLLGVNGGFMAVGFAMGANLMNNDNLFILLLISFILGAFTIIAEPAIKVLTQQIEEVTAGYIKPKTIYIALAFGVGLAILLSVVRINTNKLEVWHFLLPAFFIALFLMFFTPKVFVAIAFDAGGVATGPIIISFIVAFIQGIASASGSQTAMGDGFGMIALVAVMPIITLEILGIVYKTKSIKGGV